MEKTAGSHSEEERVRGRCVSRERGRGGRQGEEDREASKESRREDWGGGRGGRRGEQGVTVETRRGGRRGRVRSRGGEWGKDI